MTDTTEVKRFEPYTDEGNREGYGQMEPCEGGDWVHATDYDALAAKLAAAERRERQLLDTTATCRMLRRELNTAKAKLAEVEASSQGWIDAAVEQQVRRKRAEARLLEVEADVAEQRDLRNHQCKLKLEAMARAEAAEAALASMQSDALAFVLFLDENYRYSFGDIARKKIRAFYARIQTGEKE